MRFVKADEKPRLRKGKIMERQMIEGQSQEQIKRFIREAVTRAMENAGILPKEESGMEKPEYMTHLRDRELVYKDHPRIAFRGAIDSLESEIILVQGRAKHQGQGRLYEDLEEVIKAIRRLLRCEVSGEPVGKMTLQGLSMEELRERSHHPSRYYGRKHFLPAAEHGAMVANLNRLRTMAREMELTAYRAFKEESGAAGREDILRVCNRLSSLFWIMMFKVLNGDYREEGLVPVEASGRHVHLSRKDVECLFGVGYQLTKDRDLSQPGQYACKERVSVTGPKGTIQNVVVLGPEREETQVEVSFTDGLALGLQPPVRLSGDIKDTPGAILSRNGKQLTLQQGVIVAKRHVHVAKKDADALGVHDKETVSIEILSSRPVVLKDTVVRVSESFATYAHIDYDEANACGFEKGVCCRIVKQSPGGNAKDGAAQ